MFGLILLAGAYSADYTFTTAVLPGTSYRFAFLADFRTNTGVYITIAARAASANPRFSLFGGALKTDFGVNIFGVEAKIEDRVDFYRRTAKWDFKKGTYTETDTSSAEAKGSFGPVNASAKVTLEYDTEITAKADYKVGVKGNDPTQ